MQKKLILFIATLVFTAGCATPAYKKYEGVSFESFIETFPGMEVNDPNAKLAYRVKWIKKTSKLDRSFKDWCEAQGGMINYGDTGIPQYISSIYGYPTVRGGRGCVKEKRTLGAYVNFGDALAQDNIAFYTEAQGPTIRMEAERVAKVRQEKDDAEWERKRKCRLEKTQVIRTNTRPGMQTSHGMVVEIKRPLVQLQTPGSNGPILQWVEINLLEPPFGEYCN